MTDWNGATLRWLNDSAPHGILTTDAELNIRSWNHWLEVHSGYRAAEVAGRNLLVVYPELVERGLDRYYRDALAGQVQVLAQRFHRYLLPMPATADANGFTIMPQSAQIAPLVENEQVFGTITAIEDQTDRVAREEELRRQLAVQKTLYEIDHAILTLDLAECLTRVVHEAAALVGAPVAAVVLREGDALRVSAFTDNGETREALRPDASNSIVAWVARSGQAVVLADVTAEETPSAQPLFPDSRSVVAAPLVVEEEVIGALLVESPRVEAFGGSELTLIVAIATQSAIAIRNAGLFDQLQRSNAELTLAYDTTIEGWARALELRDRETEGHARRVTEAAVHLARAMGMSDGELVHIRRGALLHDIGKMAIPDTILLKPDELADDEWDVIREHPVHAYEMLLPIPFLRPALDIPYCHHEKWDGTGYPRRLKGEQIPLPARIFAVVDVYDALRSNRPYRLAWSDEEARHYIREQAGKHFDPQVVEMFMKLLENNGFDS